jgi:hypothetical protein
MRFPGDQLEMTLGQYHIPSMFDHLVDSVVDVLSTAFRADLPELGTWRPEIARRRMEFHNGLKISLFLSSNL